MIINTRIKKQLLQFYSLLNQNKEAFSSFLQTIEPSVLSTEDLDLAKLSHLLSDIASYNKEHNKIIYDQDFLSLLNDEQTVKFAYCLLMMSLYISKTLINQQSTIIDSLEKESIFSEYTNPSYLASAE